MKKLVLPFILIFFIINSLTAQEVIQKKGLFVLRQNGKPYTGIFRETDPENSLVSETAIKDGLLDGNTTIYYPSGTKKEVRAYRMGKKEGVWTSWNEAGRKTAEAGFKDGMKDGNWYVWDDNGVKRYEMFYIKGEKKGTWIIWDEKGKETGREVFN